MIVENGVWIRGVDDLETYCRKKKNEAYFERLLYANPGLVYVSWLEYPIEKWLARQYFVPSGIIDLLGVVRNSAGKPIPVVVELKNRPLKSEDVAQVSRYAMDVDEIMMRLAVDNLEPEFADAGSYKLLIGAGAPSAKVLFEAFSADVYVHSFNANENDGGITVSSFYTWTDGFRKSTKEKISIASNSKVFDVFREFLGVLNG